jgi:MFS family permease
MALDAAGRQAPTQEEDRPSGTAWRVLLLLFFGNLLNFFDRVIPSIVVEPLKHEFGLSDSDIGVLAAAFTVIYAVFGVPLGLLADRWTRKKIMGWGLAVWSVLTAATAGATGFTSLLLIRLGVGIGEATFAPAANSMLADLYPAKRRARATGLMQLGLPLGLVLAYFTIGLIAQAFGSWRAPFLFAAVPGLLLALCFFFVREPGRGAAEVGPIALAGPGDRPFRRIFSVPTVWWIVFAGVGSNMASYSVNTFTVPLFQRWFGASLTSAAALTGVVVGLTGLVGLTAGGWLADRAGHRSPMARVLVGAVAMLVAAPLALVALGLGRDAVGAYVAIFGIAWLLQYVYYVAAYPALADVVPPRLRGTAMALYFAANYLLGGAVGPVVTGVLSDSYAKAAGGPAPEAAAIGLHSAMAAVVPITLLVAAIGLFGAAWTIRRDAARMQEELAKA